jgi:hypothetical protein
MTKRNSEEAITSICDTSKSIPPRGKSSKDTTQATGFLNSNKDLAMGTALDMGNTKKEVIHVQEKE